MQIATVDQTVNEIFSILNRFGHDLYFGEHVTQLQHAHQAGELARTEGYDDEVIIAAFLHDIGHICVEVTSDNEMEGYGIKDHEKEGAKYLHQRGFSDKICQLVASHVAAKRYLTFANPAYYKSLSDASKKTLEFQGGQMTPDEAIAFETNPMFALFIRMRLWDELAKAENTQPNHIDFFRMLITQHLLNQKSNPHGLNNE